MKIKATSIKGSELKPGDLFSNASQFYWDQYQNHESLGEKVYIRTERPCPAEQANLELYKIEIIN